MKLILAVCHISYNKSESHYADIELSVSRSLIIWLYAFVALVIICKVAVIQQAAYAQMWDLSSGFVRDNTNKIQVNKNNVLQPNQNEVIVINMTSDTVAVSSDGVSKSSSCSTSSSSKSSSNCAPPPHFPSACRKLIVKNNITFKVPPAETIKYKNTIRAVSTPPITGVPAKFTGDGPVPTTESSVQEICGTNHDDYIIGSERDDIIFGVRGNDIITALDGDDLVYAGLGDDIVYGGGGNNQLFGEDGNDNLVGGTQDDLIVGGYGNDRLYGNAGDDILQGQQGADYFDCGDGLDTVVDYTPTQGDVISVSCENVNLIH